MTFASFAILAALLAVLPAQAAETCTQMGTVSLFWGTTAQTNDTATPIGWSTAASAPNDTAGHGILGVRSTVSPTVWGAFDCAGLGGGAPGGSAPVTAAGPAATFNSRVNARSGGPSSGGGGATGGGGGGAGTGGGGGGGGGNGAGLVNFFGAIGDATSNLCLTANFNNLNNMTITRSTCIQPLNLVPDPTQAWQWAVTETQHVVDLTVLDSLAFIGTQATQVLAIGSSTNYVPRIVGTGVGAYVALTLDVGGVNPANFATVPGLLVSFTTIGAPA